MLKRLRFRPLGWAMALGTVAATAAASAAVWECTIEPGMMHSNDALEMQRFASLRCIGVNRSWQADQLGISTIGAPGRSHRATRRGYRVSGHTRRRRRRSKQPARGR